MSPNWINYDAYHNYLDLGISCHLAFFLRKKASATYDCLSCRERCFLDAIGINGFLIYNFSTHDFKNGPEVAEIDQFVCSLAAPRNESPKLQLVSSNLLEMTIDFSIVISAIEAKPQTNWPSSATSESILKPRGAKLGVTKLFYRMASRKQLSRHGKCPHQKSSHFYLRYSRVFF